MNIRPVPDGKLFTLFVRFNIFFVIIENNGSLWSFYLLHVIYNFRLASKMWHCHRVRESLELTIRWSSEQRDPPVVMDQVWFNSLARWSTQFKSTLTWVHFVITVRLLYLFMLWGINPLWRLIEWCTSSWWL